MPFVTIGDLRREGKRLITAGKIGRCTHLQLGRIRVSCFIAEVNLASGRLGVRLTSAQHPAASHHLPWFLTAPGESDTLFTFTTIVVIATVLGLGVVFFRLHSLPERLGHKKLQFEIVAVLGLLSLFTHVHAFWVAGLLLALIDLPDFQTPLKRIATSLEKLSGVEPPLEPQPERKPSEPHPEPGV